jgi:hypothetical protein
MREIRTSGSEGGARQLNASFLPLSLHLMLSSRARYIAALTLLIRIRSAAGMRSHQLWRAGTSIGLNVQRIAFIQTP